MCGSAGFKVFDLGRDVPLDEFVRAAEKEECDFICMLTLLPTTMPGMRTVIEKLNGVEIKQAVAKSYGLICI